MTAHSYHLEIYTQIPEERVEMSGRGGEERAGVGGGLWLLELCEYIILVSKWNENYKRMPTKHIEKGTREQEEGRRRKEGGEEVN